MSLFELTDVQRDIRDLVRRFVDDEVAPRVVEYTRAHALPQDLVDQAAELGIVGGVVPEEYGGAGLDHVTWAICVEEIARYCTALAAVVGYPSSLAGQGLLRWGTEEQKQRFLRPLASGECLAAVGITEPDAGSDAAAMSTTATADGDEFVLNGQKTWISNATVGRWILVFATIDRTAGRDGITAFLVDAGTPGLETRPIEHKLSAWASDTGDVFLDDVRVPADRVLGTVGGGWEILLASVGAGRIHVAARSVGMAQGCLELATAYASERVAFGRSIGRFQHVQGMLAEMALATESARLLVWRAAEELDRDPDAGPYWPSLAKWHASRAAVQAAHDAVQIHGAYGLSDEYHVARHYRDAKMQEIVDGTSEIQQNIVARHLLTT
ncbi:MAG: acyl-CoA dehydrogenase family protein [Acidimicrobiia bacterium]|nr:acyl-CoA dehydrogenase family protein [Acidimicrobiia bacterium]